MRHLSLLLIFSAIPYGWCQLAAVYSDASRSNVCSHWSSWGQCVWPSGDGQVNLSSTYLDQVGHLCQRHWFYTFVARYKTVLDNFYSYMHSILKSTKPCGLCSYRQSCGFGGDKKCHLSPFTVDGGRPIIPFYVAEHVCSKDNLGGHSQVDSCVVDYNLTKQGDKECVLWPTPKVDLSSIEPVFKTHIETLGWYTCITQTKKYRKGKGRKARYRKEKVCRCCCFPFRPNPKTYKCEYVEGLPKAPGMEYLTNELRK